ncbi:LysR substrate-binding domain-containing protein [Testudinibacter aquarius]|uniref:DNA-binding transcriptional LysR family regulator n=1 Tax=Testudinibacter aquarius TaxID=1524974 RepID=A0A4V2W2Z7_9PAST|nr:LysR substrate-binding domain-containing protein [Testudinibacter aquarius]TNG92783.1 LysR family transcriptional regulator [Pasteurellaceae bacterium USgator41]TNG94840.1 LysR family transcriptional regulator [Pasteurellaceae bacterium UScroc12]TNH02495.1 LysR family transcriptional regulator [Pasteurellaceae bacterium USgator11]KAE9527104.1 hypothetical protein A1D24_12195 [Testudinibacter aquarius]TCV90019.1 DNA-binding transcriptional LysR family regulator [Testudinibacter aquarius]
MANIIPPLKSLRVFEQAAYFGNIVKAAESLNISPSAVSHQIAGLESLLDKKLFYRTGRGIKLTGIGQQYLDAISGALHTLGAATNDIIERQEQETLRIHTAPTFGLLYLLPRLEKFKKQYPEYQINIDCSYENIQFNLSQTDVDIRYGSFSWKGLSAIPIKNEYAIVLAHPDFLKKNQINEPIDLLKCDLIASQCMLMQWQQWFAYHNVQIENLSYAFSFDRSYMSFEAAKQNLGVIVESSLLAQPFIQSGELIPVFGSNYMIPIDAHYIVFPHTHKKYAKVQHFINWLEEELHNSR